jgi:protein-disulfide isomerase
MAETFRRDVFAAQNRIAGRDDLQRFTQAWFKSHQQALPFVMDASGACKKEVQADHALGDRIGRLATPCIFVVTEKRWVQVVDINQLYKVIDVALAETAGKKKS